MPKSVAKIRNEFYIIIHTAALQSDLISKPGTQVKKGLETLQIKSSLYGPYQRIGREKEYLLQLKRESWNRFLGVIKPRYKCL